MTQDLIKIEKQSSKKYKVTFAKFDGYAEVSTDQGSIFEISFHPRSRMSAVDLRNFPLQAVESLVKNEEKKSVSTKLVTSSRNNLTKEFLTSIAEQYVEALARNERPLVAISKQTGAPRNTVARWVALARKVEVLN